MAAEKVPIVVMEGAEAKYENIKMRVVSNKDVFLIGTLHCNLESKALTLLPSFLIANAFPTSFLPKDKVKVLQSAF